METVATAPWYEIRAAADEIELRLFGYFGLEITAEEFARQLDGLDRDAPLHVSLNSPGGSVFEGLSVFNRLRAHRGPVTGTVEGMAASMASVVLMAADTRRMYGSSLLMIHNAHMEAGGDHRELRKHADTLEKVRDQLVDVYASRSGRKRAEIVRWMDAETWFNATEARAAGLVDEVLDGDLDMAACVRSVDLSRFRNLPAQLRNETMSETKTPANKATDAATIVAAERERVRQIETIFAMPNLKAQAENYADLHAKARDEGWSLEDTRAAVLDRMGKLSADDAEPVAGPGFSGGYMPGVYHVDRSTDFRNAVTDMLSIRNGLRVEKPHPAARDLSRMSMVNIAEHCLRQAHVSSLPKTPSQIIKAAFTHSSSDFPAILEDTLGKALMDGYQGEPDTTAGWTTRAELRDFRQVSRVQMSEGPGLELVPEGGEYQEGSFRDRSEKYALATYGRIFSVTRQALVNDDLQAFVSIPRAFGQSVRRKHMDLVFGVLTNNPNMSDGNALFSAPHGNLAGSPAALSHETLVAARKAMRTQRGEAGLQALNIQPRHLLVPAELEDTAEQIIASLIPPGSTTDVPSLGFVRNLNLIVEPRLDADSTTAWYLVGDPAQMPTLECGFLAGQEFEIEEHLGFDTDGTAWKVRTDFGCAPLEWRTFYKNAGA
jgi:ATP-dependent Clp endopeptidase proteolytic subunit ClpP